MSKNYSYYLILIFLISTFSFFYGIYFGKFHYDGHHFGLAYSDAYEFINGKKPYKDFFSLYNYVTILIQSSSIRLFNQGVMSLVIITNLFYSISLIFLFFLSKKFLDNFNSFLVPFIIFLIHPAPTYPWGNYFLFFFVLLSLIFFLRNKYIDLLIAAFFFTLAAYTRELFFYCSIIFIIYLIFLKFSFKENKFNEVYTTKKIFFFIFSYFLFVLFFLFYFYLNNFLLSYIDYLNLPNIFMEFKDTSLLDLFLNLARYLFFWSPSRLFEGSYIVIFLGILIVNLLFIINVNLKKFFYQSNLENIELSLISIFTLLFFTFSLNEINIFRLICGSSIGLIVILYLIKKIKNKKISNYFTIILFIISIFNLSIVNKSDANLIFKTKSEISNSVSNDMKHFSSNKFSLEAVNNFYLAKEKFKKIKKNCSINYALNFQRDIFFKIILQDYFLIYQKIPWFGDISTEYFLKYYDENVYKKTRELIINNDLVIITDFKGKEKLFKDLNLKVNFYKDYYKFPFTYSQKQIIILTPKNCKNED